MVSCVWQRPNIWTMCVWPKIILIVPNWHPFRRRKLLFSYSQILEDFFLLKRLQLSKNILVDKDQVLIWQAINSFCFKLHSSIHPSLVVGAADLSILILILQSMYIILKLTKHQITNGRHAYTLLNTFTKMALVTNTLIQCYAPKKQKISMLGNRFMQNNLIRIIWICTKKVINKNVPSVFFFLKIWFYLSNITIPH